MSTVCAESLTGWWRFASVEPGNLWPSATVKTLVDSRPVWIKGSPTMLALEVHAMPYAADGMDPFSTPSLSFFSVRDLVSASDSGAGVVLSIMVFALSRVVAL